jgi:hypothetical protein
MKTMNRAPAFQFYAADWLADERVKLMSYEEQGVYLFLLCHEWLEGSIPADLTHLARLLHIDDPVSPSGAPPDAADKKLAGSSAGGGVGKCG